MEQASYEHSFLGNIQTFMHVSLHIYIHIYMETCMHTLMYVWLCTKKHIYTAYIHG